MKTRYEQKRGPFPEQSRRQSGAAGSTLLILVIIAVALWWFRPWESFLPSQPRPDAVPRPVAARGTLAEDEQNNITVFKTVSPSVVHITTLAAQGGFLSPGTQVPRGTGSGFMWDDHGNVVTNFHVVQGASGARVTLSDQSEWKAALVGAFPDRDLAVLRIDAPKEKIRPILIGNSRELQVGQKVYAIGNPFGLDQTLTTGIISALDREIESVTQRAIRGVIQTDAAINPGNSGGPLLDSAGRLIGVTTAIVSPSGAYAGIGFAIPVDEVNRIVPRLIRDGKFIRPTIGIQAAPPNVQEALKLPKGVAIIGVFPGSPAQKAGLKPFQRGPDGSVIQGDIIVAFDGKPVATVDDLLERLEQHKPGETVNLTIQRGDQKIEQPITLAIAQ